MKKGKQPAYWLIKDGYAYAYRRANLSKDPFDALILLSDGEFYVRCPEYDYKEPASCHE